MYVHTYLCMYVRTIFSKEITDNCNLDVCMYDYTTVYECE